MKYETEFKTYLSAVHQTLDQILPPETQYPFVVHEAMRYAVLTGGKFFRPVLCLAACEATGASFSEALAPAASLEFIHASSLVHDDLPSLDNDDYRRGKPSVHKRFGEAMAILTGDALLTLAFQSLGRVSSPQKVADLLAEISTAVGTYGMIGGQVADMTSKDQSPDLPTLDYINVHKTGKLIKASAVAGAIAAGAGKDAHERILRYGECLGLAFQAIDDLSDGDGYVTLMRPRELRQKVRDLIAKAKRVVRPLGKDANKLQLLAEFLLSRMPKETKKRAQV